MDADVDVDADADVDADVDAYTDTDDVETLVRTPLPKHTDFGTLLARWQDVARRFRERSREGRHKRRVSRDRKEGKVDLELELSLGGEEGGERKVRISVY